MHVWMKAKVAAPRVQHHRDSKLCAEALRIATKRQQGLGRRGKQKTEDSLAIELCEGAKLRRQRKDDVSEQLLVAASEGRARAFRRCVDETIA